MEREEEATVWKLILAGNRDALEHLYRRYYSSMLAYGLKFCNQEDIIKDCIHNVFLKIFENKTLKTPPSIHGYLLRSVKNSLYDVFKTNHSIENIDDLSFSFSIEDSALTRLFANNDEQLKLSRQIKCAYDSLSDNQKQILYLRYIKQLSFKEIAALLEINEQSAMNLSSRTLSKLRKLILPGLLFLLSRLIY